MDKYIGTLLGGRYEILEVLGVGGMAIVYKARCRVLNRYVAIKMLKDEFAEDEEFRRRFYNESQAVAKLSHNNIVAVYDVAHSDGVNYIVMELIDGISLKEYLQKKGHLSWQETVFFAQQIARALEHAHSRGIIHQDIKPHNIMLLRDGTAKVTDFGIARLESNQETRVVQEAIGSVHYIAPEQAKGSTIDARADLYSLGVVMYEMLTGKLPFEGDTAVAIVMQHINSVPMLPSELVAGIPSGMDDIVMHAMCPNVSRRYATAQQMYNDLERLKQNANATFGYAAHNTRGDTPLLDETRAISYDAMRSANAAPAYDSRRETPAKQAVHRMPSQQEADYAPRRPRKKSFGEKIGQSPVAIAGIVVAVIAVIAVIVGGFLLFSGSGGKVTVPDFVGKNIEQVLLDQDTKYDDFYLVEAKTRVYDPDFQEGQIIEQNPKRDKKVAKGTKIVLTVCGPEEKDDLEDAYEMLDFSEMELEQVERLLKQNDLEDSYEIKEEASDEIEKGYVIRTTPGEGAKVTPDDKIIIYVSTGKATETVKVPGVIGMTLDKAKDMLTSYGLQVGETYNEEHDSPVGKVFRQSVEEGTEVEEGTQVNLYVSKGKVTEEPDPHIDPNGSGNSSQIPGEPSDTKNGTASISVALPDAESSHVVVYLGDKKLADKTFSPSGGTQVIEVNGPAGEQMLTVYVDGDKRMTPVTFN